MLGKDWIVVVKVTDEVQNSSECSSELISSAAEPSVTKLGMMMRDHGPVLCKKIGLLSFRSPSQ